MDDPDSIVIDGIGNHVEVDNLVPESGPGQAAVGFNAAAQREKFLGGASITRRDLLKKAAIAGGDAVLVGSGQGDPSRMEQGEIQIPVKAEKIPPANEKTMEVNGRQWHYSEHGDPNGIPVLNIHGWLGSVKEGNARFAEAMAGEPRVDDNGNYSLGLQNLAKEKPESAQYFVDKTKALKGKYRVITPDLPGFGVTAPIPNVSLEKLAEEIHTFSQAVGMEKPVLAGTSMGGILAVEMAAMHPEDVSGIILQGTMTRPEDMEQVKYKAGQIGSIPLLNFLLKPVFSTAIKFDQDFKLADKATQDLVLNAMPNADRETVAATLGEIGHDIGSYMDRVTCPVMLIDGVDGEMVPIEGTRNAGRERFHKDRDLEGKAHDFTVSFFSLGSGLGKQGHNLVNTAPEPMAVLTDKVIGQWQKLPPKAA